MKLTVKQHFACPYINLAFNAEQESVRASCMEKIMKFIDGDFTQHINMDTNITGVSVLEDVKESLDKLSPEERDNYLDLCDKMDTEENENSL